MPRIGKKGLGPLVTEAGLITEEQFLHAAAVEEETKKPLRNILLDYEYVSESQLLECFEKQLRIPHINLNLVDIDPEVATSIPIELAREHRVIPIKREGKKMTLAMANPLDLEALDSAALFTGCEICPAAVGESSIISVIEQFFAMKESVERIRENQGKYPVGDGRQQAFGEEENVHDEPVVRVVNSIIQRGILEAASDIHLDPQEEGLRIRLRIDGVLHELISSPEKIQPQIISRIKIMAGMDISEKRLPQEGRMIFLYGNQKIHLRVSTLPIIFGEKIVIRLLNREKIIVPLEGLGFNLKNFSLFENMIRSSSGMILVCGPTGCGKSTTLYSTLNHVNSKEKNIITVEDPVEYNLTGINQVQVNPKTGLSFARALRTILRQDPDIIMLGEIRDLETGNIAVRAALTGHLVFSTLHTNDAAKAVTRLLDMGIEDYLAVSSVVGIVAQRLLRVICSHCREEYTPPEEEKKLFQKYGGVGVQPVFSEGKGCFYCNGTGFKGRTAVHEILIVTDELKKIIMQNPAPDEMLRYMKNKKISSLQQEGMKLAAQGITTISEVIRVTFEGGVYP